MLSQFFSSQAAAQAVVSLAYTLVAFLLFAGFGPPLISVPLAPMKIKDVPDHLIPQPSVVLEGPWAPDRMLESATVLFNNSLLSSESVLINDDGSLLLMDKYGRVYTAAHNTSAPGEYTLADKHVAQLGPGRPLGFKKTKDGSIIVCNAGLGLVKLELPDSVNGLTQARVTLIGSYVSDTSPIDPGSQILYPNDLEITSDGSVVYFTDSQALPVLPNWGSAGRRVRPWYDTYTSFLMGVYSGQATGRLLAYYPANNTIHVLLKGFWYSNGVALSPDESYVLFTETNLFRVVKYWLKGEKAGEVEVFIDKLPGFPDGINTAPNGKGYWIALPSPHTKLFDWAAKIRIIRVVLAWLPPHIRPPIPTWGAVVLVDLEGQVSQFLLDPDGKLLSHLSDVDEEILPDGRSRLWMGTVKNHYLSYIDLNNNVEKNFK